MDDKLKRWNESRGQPTKDRLAIFYPKAPEHILIQAAKIYDQGMQDSLTGEKFTTGYSIQAADKVRKLMKDYL